jgi:hypothetical protein
MRGKKQMKKIINPKYYLNMLMVLIMAMVVGTANAAVDVSGPVTAFTTDGTAAITAIGAAMLTLAGIAVTYKWAKATFFG